MGSCVEDRGEPSRHSPFSGMRRARFEPRSTEQSGVLRRYGETPIKTVPRTFVRDVRKNLHRSGRESAATTVRGTLSARPVPRNGDRLRGPRGLRPRFAHLRRSTDLPFGSRLQGIPRNSREPSDDGSAIVPLPSSSIRRGRLPARNRLPWSSRPPSRHRDRYPDHHLVFICNTGEERDRLAGGRAQGNAAQQELLGVRAQLPSPAQPSRSSSTPSITPGSTP